MTMYHLVTDMSNEKKAVFMAGCVVSVFSGPFPAPANLLFVKDKKKGLVCKNEKLQLDTKVLVVWNPKSFK